MAMIVTWSNESIKIVGLNVKLLVNNNTYYNSLYFPGTSLNVVTPEVNWSTFK